MASATQIIAKSIQAQRVASNRASMTLRGHLERAMFRAVRSVDTQGIVLEDELGPRIQAVLISIYEEIARAEGLLLEDQFKHCYLHLETKTKFAMFDRIAAHFFDMFGATNVVKILDTTRVQLVTILSQAQTDGLSVVDIGKLFRRKIPQLAELRSNIIAQTEAHSAAIFASQEVAKSSRFPLEKTWVTTQKASVRSFLKGNEFSHRQMHGVTIPLEALWDVPRKDGTTEKLRFIGDPNGSAGNVIKCQCAQIYRRVSN